MNEKLAHVLLFLVAIVWGTGFVATHIALETGITPYYMMGLRFSIAAAIVFAIFYKRILKNLKSHSKPGVVLGIFLFVAFAFQTIGLQYTTPSKNAFITAVNVVMAPFIYWVLLKKTIDKYTLIGAFLAIVGIGYLTLDGGVGNVNLGDALTLVCAFFFALHIVFIGFYAKDHDFDPITLVFLQFFVATLLSWASTFIFEDFSYTSITRDGAWAILYLGLFSTLLAFFTQNIAQKYVDQTKTAIILSTEAVFGTLASIIIINEAITSNMVIGSIIVFIAIIIVETKLTFLRSTKKLQNS